MLHVDTMRGYASQLTVACGDGGARRNSTGGPARVDAWARLGPGPGSRCR